MVVLAYVDPSHVLEAERRGTLGFVVKPVDFPALK